MRPVARPAVAVGLAAVVALAASCGDATSGAEEDPIKLPDRLPPQDAGRGPRGGEGGAPTDAAGDAADGSVARPLCGEPDLLLCFSFEGEVKDGSPSALAPSAVQGVTFTAGRSGQAAVFADTSFIHFSSAPQLTAPVTTVEAWVRPAQVIAES